MAITKLVYYTMYVGGGECCFLCTTKRHSPLRVFRNKKGEKTKSVGMCSSSKKEREAVWVYRICPMMIWDYWKFGLDVMQPWVYLTFIWLSHRTWSAIRGPTNQRRLIRGRNGCPLSTLVPKKTWKRCAFWWRPENERSIIFFLLSGWCKNRHFSECILLYTYICLFMWQDGRTIHPRDTIFEMSWPYQRKVKFGKGAFLEPFSHANFQRILCYRNFWSHGGDISQHLLIFAQSVGNW